MATLQTARQPSFKRGANDSAAPEEVQPSEVRQMYDCRLSLSGNGAIRRGGSQQLHSSALNSGATVYGLVSFTTGSGTGQLLAFVGDTLFTSTDGGSTWTSEQTGLNEAYWDFAITDVCGTPEVIAANGDTNVHRWDGSTWSQLSGAPSGVKYLAVYHNRLYVAGHNEETIQASAVSDFDEWGVSNGAINLKAGIHDGDPVIRALYQLGPYLLIFKSESVGYLEGYGFETLNVETGAEGISRSVGCLGFRTVKGTSEEAVLWLSERGMEYLSVGSGVQLVGRPLQGFFESVSRSAVRSTEGLPSAVYWGEKNEYWCAVPTEGATQNDRIYVWRPPGGSTSSAQWIFRPSFDVASLSLDHDKQPICGGYDGFMRQMETGLHDDRSSDGSGGTPVVAELRSKPFLYGDQATLKKARIIRANVEAPAQATLTVEPVADGDVADGRDMTFKASSGISGHKARVLARGHVLGVHASWEDPDLKLQGLQLDAEPLRRAW